jgi:phosphohistidine phosphatase SixA
MRYLTIVRHAEALGHGSAERSDFDRVLTPRGRSQCEELRTWATDARSLGAYGPTTALVSGAARTRETYAVAFAGTSFVTSLQTTDALYNGKRHVRAEDVLRELSNVDVSGDSLLVVAHNPTVLEVVVSLADAVPDDLQRGEYPLAGAYVLAIDDEPVSLRTYELVASFIPTS